MASPQAENGHIDIANEIVEALCQVNLSKYEGRCLWALWRKTYGWHKKADKISLSQFTKLTTIPSHNVSRTLTRLEKRQIITINHNGKGNLTQYQFQKDYTKWLDFNYKPLSIQIVSTEIVSTEIVSTEIVSTEIPTTIYTDSQLLSTQIDTKETIQKKLYKREDPLSTFNEYIEKELRPAFPQLDIDKELKNFQLYFEKQPKKLTNKLSFRQWLERVKPKKRSKFGDGW